jgi:hypothetical protein
MNTMDLCSSLQSELRAYETHFVGKSLEKLEHATDQVQYYTLTY